MELLLLEEPEPERVVVAFLLPDEVLRVVFTELLLLLSEELF